MESSKIGAISWYTRTAPIDEKKSQWPYLTFSFSTVAARFLTVAALWPGRLRRGAI